MFIDFFFYRGAKRGWGGDLAFYIIIVIIDGNWSFFNVSTISKTTVCILSMWGAFLKDRILEMRLLSQKINIDQNCSPETCSHIHFFAFGSCWGCCIIYSLLLISAATFSFLSHSSHWMSPFFSYHLYMLICKHLW